MIIYNKLQDWQEINFFKTDSSCSGSCELSKFSYSRFSVATLIAFCVVLIKSLIRNANSSSDERK